MFSVIAIMCMVALPAMVVVLVLLPIVYLIWSAVRKRRIDRARAEAERAWRESPEGRKWQREAEAYEKALKKQRNRDRAEIEAARRMRHPNRGKRPQTAESKERA